MKNIVILGAPGSGKGTISSFLVKNYSFQQISTGDLLREISNSTSELSSRIQAIISKGELVPDSIVAEMLEAKIIEFVQNGAKGLIFDGYPRTFAQTEMLDEIVAKQNLSITNVLELDISLKDLETRILNRYSCASCGEIYNYISKPTKINNICDKCGSHNLIKRNDDKKEVLEQRYKTYEQNIAKIKEYYSQRNLYQKIDATLTVQEIQNKVKDIIEL